MAGRFALFQRPCHSCGNVVGGISDFGKLGADFLRVVGAEKIGRILKTVIAHISAELFAEDIRNAMRLEAGIFRGVFFACLCKLGLCQRL